MRKWSEKNGLCFLRIFLKMPSWAVVGKEKMVICPKSSPQKSQKRWVGLFAQITSDRTRENGIKSR